MRFSRLRLIGFKSFVEPADFVIESGLTGIVGPNGCGKSNLVEALRWVMGESSYKNMRASGMDDVIFSGSATRPSRNTAEVALFLDNADRSAPPAYNDGDEIQVSRRIERDAGSVYRINGREARAKDVQLLFADQSTGARSPSMVGQGRIGELIQAKPQARRALLEEAAGISGLHTRRHEAELRMRAAEQNLERLDDVTGAMETQIESLRRQARQAVRFKTLSAELRRAEASLLHLRWTAAKAQESDANAALTVATSVVGERAIAQIAAARDQGMAAQTLPGLRDAAARAGAVVQRLTVARAQLEDEAARLAQRRAELQKRVTQFDADIGREKALVADNEEVLARLATEADQLAGEEAGAAGRETGMRAAFDEAAATLTLSERALTAITAERAEAAASRGQIERAAREAAERSQRLDRQLRDAEGEVAALETRRRALPDPVRETERVAAAVAAVADAEGVAVSAERRLAEARAAEHAARPAVNEARATLARIETEARTLAKILQGQKPDRFPAVVESIEVERGFEAALGAALGDDLDASVDSSAPVHWSTVSVDGDAPLPPGIRGLADVVRAPAELARGLAQIGIVTAADGKRLQAMLKPGQRLVSTEGALWRWDGLVARADAPSAAAQRLAQKNRLLELESEASKAKRGAVDAETRFSEAEVAVRQAADAERTAREQARVAQRTLGEAREALAKAERGTADITARLAALSASLKALAEARGEAAEAIEAGRLALADAADPKAMQARYDGILASVARDRAQLADARARHEGLKREADARARRLAAIGVERDGWLARRDNADRQIAALAARREEAASEAQALNDAPGEIDARRRALLGEFSRAETDRKATADATQAAENRQAVLDKGATAAIQALAEAREARARAEERLTAADDRRREIEARIAEAIGVEPHLVLRHAGIAADDTLPDIAELERQIERIRVERERLGAVNLRAEDEQKELARQLETLVAERADVVDAIRKLRQAVASLNREGRERLLAAFDVVNAQFQRLFSHLFGGGTAELQLIESDDPLEAGLEILARPPGKKPQTMTLLSGGEQALTAMALIFAVFLTNPAPICVLDEVDAPLDDHNVERFCNLMDDMAETTDTRFLIITHNPITMSRMSRLFGVTMAEQGISTLVSVNLETAERMREAG